jgi:hypothetical protein
MNTKVNSNLNDNITFFFEEKDDIFDTEENYIQKIIEEINYDQDLDQDLDQGQDLDHDLDQDLVQDLDQDHTNAKLMYFMDKEFYGNDELYYNQEYTVKDLLKICEYYGIEKNIKSSKCKKQDIISTIVYFESVPSNYGIVKTRNIMWAYMSELMNNTKMKKYVIWN